MKLREKGRAICGEGPEKVLSTSYTGLLLAVYLRYSPEYKYYRQESTKNRRQFPVGSVVSTGRNSVGNNAAGNWQPSQLRLKLYNRAIHARRTDFELAPKFTVGTFHITRMRPQMEQRLEVHDDQRPPTGFVRYERVWIAMTIVRLELPHWTTERRAQLNGKSSGFPIDRSKRLAECPLLATTARRARRVLFGSDKFVVRINVYVAKGTGRHRLHHTLLCKNFEKKWFSGFCLFVGGVTRVLSIISAQMRLDAEHWGMNVMNSSYGGQMGDVDK